MKISPYQSHKITFAVLANICALSLSPETAVAQTFEDVLRPFENCAKDNNSNSRLACYDRAMGAARLARSQAQAQAKAEAERLAQQEQENFGFPKSAIQDKSDTPAIASSENEADFGKSIAQINREREERGEKKQERPSQSIALKSFRYDAYKKLRVELENGQVWKSTGASDIRGRLRKGAATTITKTSFGGYRLKINGTSGFDTVKRLK